LEWVQQEHEDPAQEEEQEVQDLSQEEQPAIVE
jgi:hypothetical protein